jgi:hypothetical protein
MGILAPGIMDALANLNDRVIAIEEKIDDSTIDDLKGVLDSQTLIDELLVKNSDDIISMKKVKQENDDAIKNLVSIIEVLDRELEVRTEELKKHNDAVHLKQKETIKIICKHFNRGYCKRKSLCWYFHLTDICKIFLKDGKCSVKDCFSRHPNFCKFQKQGCNRGSLCDYLHRNSDKKDETFEKDSSKNYDDIEVALDNIRIGNIDMEIETIVEDP